MTISQKQIGLNKVGWNSDVLNFYVLNGKCIKKHCPKSCTYQRVIVIYIIYTKNTYVWICFGWELLVSKVILACMRTIHAKTNTRHDIINIRHNKR